MKINIFLDEIKYFTTNSPENAYISGILFTGTKTKTSSQECDCSHAKLLLTNAILSLEKIFNNKLLRVKISVKW